MIISGIKDRINGAGLQIAPSPSGWLSVSRGDGISDRQRAALALASVRQRRKLRQRPYATTSDLEAVRRLLDVPHAVVLLDDGGTWGESYGGKVGTLRHLERVRGRWSVQYGAARWELIGGPLWLLDVAPDEGAAE